PTEKIDTIAGSKAYGSVTATAGLPWTISQTTDNGITVAPVEGSGSAALTFTATANTGPERTGTFTIMVKDANPERTVTVAVNQVVSINNILIINSTVVAKYKEMTTDYILYPPFNYDGGASSGTTGFDRNGVSSNCTLDEEYFIEVEITDRASYSSYAIALSYCKGKGTDWRIPTMIELKAIYDNKATLQKNGCAAFVSNGNYWSSSVGGNEKGNGSDSGRRCRLFFGDSDPDRVYTNGNGFIRCVRDI
ncbi:MAG: hypothetical protein LUD46_02595, partial [Parabacteroides sp.]|nr:hypothetical protein [Parabacteroides sp.]